MVSGDRALLRLHIEAVWDVQLSPVSQNNIELLGCGKQPPWKVYVAEMGDERVTLWRPDVPTEEREGLLARVNAAFALPPTSQTAPGVSREVALHQTALPTISVREAQKVARLLTPHDKKLVEAFEAGSGDYYFHPHRRPLVGIIIEGCLRSIAHSSRRTAEACELGIETSPEARRKGYALAATVQWAALVAQEGLVPLYSAFADNTASLSLAAAAGYRAFARAVTIRE